MPAPEDDDQARRAERFADLDAPFSAGWDRVGVEKDEIPGRSKKADNWRYEGCILMTIRDEDSLGDLFRGSQI